MKWGILVFIIIVGSCYATEIELNEIMYNPPGRDNDKEWFEIYNPDNEFLNFEEMGFAFGDDKSIDLILDCSGWYGGTNATYVIIAPLSSHLYEDKNISEDQIFNPSDIDDPVDCYSIGNGLKNSQDYIELWLGEDPIDFFDYNNSIGANGDGNSIQYINESWVTAPPTPGRKNSLEEKLPETEDIDLSINLNEFINKNIEHTNLFKIKINNKENCSLKDDVTVKYSVTSEWFDYDFLEWITDEYIFDEFTKEVGCSASSNTGSITLDEAGQYQLCGEIIDSTIEDLNSKNDKECANFEIVDTSTIPCNISLNINTTNNAYEYDNKIKYSFLLTNKTFLNDNNIPYKIEYWAEDLEGNIIKKKYNTTNTKQKSYKPRISEIESIIKLKSKLGYIACNDTNLSDNEAEVSIIYTCEPLDDGLKLEVCMDGNCDSTSITQLASYNKLFKITNLGYVPCFKQSINLTIQYNITDTNGTLIKQDSFELTDLNHYKSSKTGEWMSEETGNYTICGQIINSTINQTAFACKNITVTPNPFSILSLPTTTSFGSFDFITLHFNPAYYEHNKTRFIIYGTNKKIISDLTGEKIKSYSKCQGETSMELNTSTNQSYFLRIPFFLYPNCDNKYSNGDHKLSLRVCSPKTNQIDFEKFFDYTFELSILGKSSGLCPLPVITTAKTKAPSSNLIQFMERTKKDHEESFTYDNTKFKIIFPEEIKTSEKFFIPIFINNTDGTNKKFEIWSYIYKGRTSLMEKTANKQIITLKSGESKNVKLENKIIQENVKQDDYKSMVKINSETMKSVKSKSKEVNLITKQIQQQTKTTMNSEIISFHTRNKKPKDEIILITSIQNNAEKEQKLSLILESFVEHIEENITIDPKSKEQFKFEVKLFSGKNVFFLKLKQNKELIDHKELILFSNNEEIKTYNENEMQYLDFIESLQQEITGTAIYDVSKQSQPKEQIVYKSKSQRIKENIIYFLVFALTLLLIIFIFKI